MAGGGGSIFLFLSCSPFSTSPKNQLACWSPVLDAGVVSRGKRPWCISAGLDLAQAKDTAFFNQ